MIHQRYLSPTRFLTALLTGLLITTAATGCRKVVHRTSAVLIVPDTLVAGTVINSAGTWSANTPDGSQHLVVTVSGTSISWSLETREMHPGGGSSSGSSSSGMSLSSPSDPWFIFVESPQRLWFFNGKDGLDYRFRSPDGGSEGGTSIFSGELHTASPPVPNELVPHLPPELRKLLPHVTPSGKRPSL